MPMAWLSEYIQGRIGKLPLDAKLGRELATRINAAYTGRIKSVVFTYDPFAESDEIDGSPLAAISPFNLEHVRESRGDWRRDVRLLITMIVKQAPNEDAGFFDIYLDSWDDLLEVVKADAWVDAMEISGRYELDQSQTQARLICQAIIDLNFA